MAKLLGSMLLLVAGTTATTATTTEAATAAKTAATSKPAMTTPLGDTRVEVAIGRPLRDATLQGLNGSSRKLSDFRGTPLIINVWASWCGPCLAEMASLERLAWRDTAKRFTVIGISTDDYVDKAQAQLKKSNATISQFIDSKLQMENMLGATRLPLTVLIDADGRVLNKIYGAREWDDADALRLIGKTFAIRTDEKSPGLARRAFPRF